MQKMEQHYCWEYEKTRINQLNEKLPFAVFFISPKHSKQQMAVCSLSLHLCSSESRKRLERKFIFQTGTLNPHDINERFSFNDFIPALSPYSHQWYKVAPFSAYQPTHNSSNRADEGLTLETPALKLFTVANLRFQLSC